MRCYSTRFCRLSSSAERSIHLLAGRLFGGLDLIGGDAAQVLREPQFRERPDDPLGRIELPWLYSIAVVVLKLMVIVVIAFAESEEGQEKRIARAALLRIRLPPDGVTGAVDEEGAMLQDDHACHARDEKGAERSPPSVPKKADHDRDEEADHDRDQLDVSMLPADQLVSLKVADVIQGMIGMQFEKEPTDMGVKETFRDAVGIVVVIDVFVMTAMLARPGQD